MEFLTDYLRETISKLNETQKEEIDVIESIINANETNRENVKEKIIRFIQKHKPENCIMLIINCIERAVIIRPKDIDSLLFFNNFNFRKFQFKLRNSEIY